MQVLPTLASSFMLNAGPMRIWAGIMPQMDHHLTVLGTISWHLAPSLHQSALGKNLQITSTPLWTLQQWKVSHLNKENSQFSQSNLESRKRNLESSQGIRKLVKQIWNLSKAMWIQSKESRIQSKKSGIQSMVFGIKKGIWSPVKRILEFRIKNLESIQRNLELSKRSLDSFKIRTTTFNLDGLFTNMFRRYLHHHCKCTIIGSWFK